MTITIYGSIGSRASRCLWVAEELGIPHVWNPISTLDGSNRTSAYLSINPSGKIPALTDGDVVMTESMAINQYLAENYGRGTLWPDSRKAQGLVLQWTFWSATEIEYYVGAIFLQLLMTPPQDRNQSLIDRLIGEMMPKFAALEAALEGKDYVLGGFTLADINLAVQLFTIVDRFGLDFGQLPLIRAYTERCRERPARLKIAALVAAAAKKAWTPGGHSDLRHGRGILPSRGMVTGSSGIMVVLNSVKKSALEVAPSRPTPDSL